MTSERQLMEQVVRLVGERRRLWPADGASSVACLGLLGWVNEVYLHPQQAVQELMGWMWMGGVLGSASGARGHEGAGMRAGVHTNAHAHTNTHTNTQGGSGFDAADQQAIEAYAAGVAGQVLAAGTQDHEGQAQQLEQLEPVDMSVSPKWTGQELRALMALGSRHGAVMREVLAGVLGGFESGRGYAMPQFGEPKRRQEQEAQARRANAKTAMNPRWVSRGQSESESESASERESERRQKGEGAHTDEPGDQEPPAAVRRLRDLAVALNAVAEPQGQAQGEANGQTDDEPQVLGFALQMNALSQMNSPLKADPFASAARPTAARAKPEFLRNASRRY